MKKCKYSEIMYAIFYLKANKISEQDIASKYNLEKEVVFDFLENAKDVLELFKRYTALVEKILDKKFCECHTQQNSDTCSFRLDRIQNYMGSKFGLKGKEVDNLESTLDVFILKTTKPFIDPKLYS